MDQNEIITYCMDMEKGDHISCVFRTKKELFSLLVPFFTTGLQQNNTCAYVLGEYTSDDVIDTFREYQFDLTPYISKGQFMFLQIEDVYLKNGEFNAKRIISDIQDMVSTVLNQGFAGLRLTGNAAWLTKHTSCISETIKYEAKINHAIEDLAVTAVCQYNESLFDHTMLVDVLRTHPTIFLYDRIISNPYFAPSEDYIPFSDISADSDMYGKMTQFLYASVCK